MSRIRIIEPTTTMSAAELVARGYRKVSNGHCLVARIDTPNWVDVLARNLRRSPAEFYESKNDYQPSGHWCDHYRRCFSHDTLVVSPETLKHIPPSGFDNCGYIPPFPKSQSVIGQDEGIELAFLGERL